MSFSLPSGPLISGAAAAAAALAQGRSREELERMAHSGELSPSVLSHLEGSYREAFLQFIGRQGSTLLRKG